MGNGVPGVARWLDVAPDRLAAWMESFAQRHGALTTELEPGERSAARPVAVVTFRAADGSVAECHIPFPPLSAGEAAAAGTDPAVIAARLAAHASAERVVGVLLVRLGGYAAGVFGPYSGRLDAVLLGGDKRAMAGLAGDPRLRPYLELAVDRFLTVPDPRLAVLKGTPRMFRAIRVRLTEAAPPAS